MYKPGVKYAQLFYHVGANKQYVGIGYLAGGWICRRLNRSNFISEKPFFYSLAFSLAVLRVRVQGALIAECDDPAADRQLQSQHHRGQRDYQCLLHHLFGR